MYVPENQTIRAGLPLLMSFPRTGSHWLRMALELYFDRPMLTRHFFEHADDRMLLWHDHDKELKLRPDGPVVYLYRGPVDVVFSELTYHLGERAVDAGVGEVVRVAEHYRKHLRRWLLGEGLGARPDAVIAYEWMLDRPIGAIRPVVELLGEAGEVFDEGRLREAWARVTPSVVREKTEYISEVMDRAANKELRRCLFRYRHGGRVLDLFRGDAELCGAMDPGLLDESPAVSR
ncbi:MAG: hypothetical protein H6810_11825 [Phycisphaeraceae bacterium]|nr:MAG: hypothetical protein H6810_11825 [Phycisphaeraceae bacterium]